ncbi:MAG: VWA domain-containing protein [Pirellulaceae bacterium]
MYLESPQLLLLLWLLPAVGGLLVYAQRRRVAAAHRFAGDVMSQRLMPTAAGGRNGTKAIALLVGLGLLVFAAARPRWGVYFEDVQSRGVDMFVLLDVSRSMLAEDVAPNRLERAKSDIRDLLPYLEGDRVGLIAFAGAAVVQTPLTTDQGFFRMVLDVTDPDSAPRGGSLIGDAIRKALESMEPRHDRDQVIVLITDGEDHDSFPAEAAKAAAERNVKVICVGLGDTDEGMRIPIRDESGQLAYMKHDGQEVWSKMDEALLKEIALTTGGAYIPAKTRAYDLGQVYSQHLAGLSRGEITAEKRKRYRERFQLFVVLGVVVLLLEMVIPRYPRMEGVSDSFSAIPYSPEESHGRKRRPVPTPITTLTK